MNLGARAFLAAREHLRDPVAPRFNARVMFVNVRRRVGLYLESTSISLPPSLSLTHSVQLSRIYTARGGL